MTEFDPIAAAQEADDELASKAKADSAAFRLRKQKRAADEFARFLDPDVSVRLEGNAQDAKALLPQALQLLKRATLFREAGQPVVKMWAKTHDGSLLWAFLHGPVKHLYVRPGPRLVKPPVPAPEEEVVLEQGVVYLMLSGVVRPGTKIDVYSAEHVLIDERAHEFHPTQVCANVYDLKYAYQDMGKLGVDNPQGSDLQAHYPKPSMYSGAMKRVVQALYGIGKTGATTMSADVGGAGTTTVQNFYQCAWDCTHGIFRDSQGVWLIEISKARGVLKMKLPIFDGTEADTYLDFLVGIGDSDTASIVTEFGGLPNGETFPENDENSIPPVMALDVAIAAGTVIRLLLPSDIAAFYIQAGSLLGGPQITKVGLWSNCGWAFSETGLNTEAHNTCFWYSDWAKATIFDSQRADAVPHDPPRLELFEYDARFPLSTVIPLEDRAMRAEHWKISLAGTAMLSVVEKSLLAGPQKSTFLLAYPDLSVYSFEEMLRVPGDERLSQFEYWGRPPTGPGFNMPSGTGLAPTSLALNGKIYLDQDCPVMVFYRGDALEVVRHQYERTYANGYVSGYSDTPHSTGAGVEWQYLHAFSTTTSSAGMFDCQSTETYNPPNWGNSDLGQLGFSAPTAYQESNNSYQVTQYSVPNGGPIVFCGANPSDVVENVMEYSVTATYLTTSSGYGGLFGIWIVPWTYTANSYTEAAGIGAGSNTSQGYIVSESSVFTADYSAPILDTRRTSDTDVEGFIYDAMYSLGGLSRSSDGFYLLAAGLNRRWSLKWRRAGAFYSTSVDLRKNERWGCQTNLATPTGFTLLSTAPNWEQEIGLVVPGFIREGFLFAVWSGGEDRSGLATYDLWINNNGVPLPEKVDQRLFAPGLGAGTIAGPTLNPITNFQWVKFVNAFHFKYSASINAGPTQCGIVQDGIYADVIFIPFINEKLTGDPTFLGTANGIPVDDCIAADTTFVGAV